MGCAGGKPAKAKDEDGGKLLLTDDELFSVGNLWTNLRESSADSGLYIFQHWFDMFPEVVERFAFAKDQYGNILLDLMQTKNMRNHAIGVMNKLDAMMMRLFKRDPEVAKLIYDVGVHHQTRNINEDEMTKMSKSIYSAVRDINVGPHSDKELAALHNLLEVVSYHFKRGLRGEPYEKEPLNQRDAIH